MRVAIYIRVARADQLAADMQLEYLKNYTEKKGYEVAAIFALNGISGLHTNEYMNGLLKLAKAVKAEKIVTRCPTRISRDSIQYIETETMFRAAGIELEYTEQPDVQVLTDGMKHLIEHFNRIRGEI